MLKWPVISNFRWNLFQCFLLWSMWNIESVHEGFKQGKYCNYLALRVIKDFFFFFNVWNVGFRKPPDHIFLKALLPSYRWRHALRSVIFFRTHFYWKSLHSKCTVPMLVSKIYCILTGCRKLSKLCFLVGYSIYFGQGTSEL